MTEDWKQYRIGDLFEIKIGGDLQESCFSEKRSPAFPYPVFSNSLTNKGLYGYTSKPRFAGNSITITGRGDLGHAEYRCDPFDAIVRLIVLAPKIEIDCEFLTFFINHKVRFPKETTGVPQLTAPRVGKTKITIPTSVIEQRAIATVLNKVDAVISATQASITKAERLKKSLIQNLLTGIMKPDGRKRKENELSYSESLGFYPTTWNYTCFKDVSVLQRGKDLTDVEVVPGIYPVVKSNGTTIHHNRFTCEPPGVVTGRSGTIGKVFFIEENYWAHNTTLYVKDFKGNSPKFIYYLIQTMRFEKYYAGTTIPTLNRNDIHKVRVAIPKTAQEQNAICKLIDDAETVLQSKQIKIKKMERLKKALMQNLLTGKTRLNIPRFQMQ